MGNAVRARRVIPGKTMKSDGPATQRFAPPAGRAPTTADRAGAAGIIVLIIASLFIFSPAAPHPLDLARHGTSAVGTLLIGAVALRAVLGGGFPIPPLSVALIAIVASAFASTAMYYLFQSYSFPNRSAPMAAALIGLFLVAAQSRSAARAHLGIWILSAITAVCAVVATTGLLEAAGIDPLSTDGYYNSSAHPVATFGNADAAVDFIIPAAMVALGLACARGGWARVAALAAASVACAWAGWLGVLYSCGAVVVGAVAAVALTVARARHSGASVSSALRPAAVNCMIPVALFFCVFYFSPARAGSDVRPASAPSTTQFVTPADSVMPPSRGLVPASLEVRLRIWARCIDTFRSFAPFGTLAGNFSIGFAPFRDPVEIEISTRNRADSAESTVNSAHNDPLQFITETGALGIFAIGAFVVGFFRWLRRGILHSTANTVAASAGLSAMFVNMMFHSALYEVPSFGVLFFVLLGIVGAADARQPEVLSGREGRVAGIIGLLCIPYFCVLAGQRIIADYLIITERRSIEGGAARLADAASWNAIDERIPAALARRLEAEGNIPGALAAWQSALSRNPFYFEALFQIGVLLARQGDFKGAMGAFDLCIPLDRYHPKLIINRASAARDMGDDTLAASILRQAAGQGIKTDTLRTWGAGFLEAKDYKRVAPYLDAWVAIHPDDAAAWHMLGTSSLKLNNRSSAGVELSNAHRLYALEHILNSDLTAATVSARQYRNWADPTDAGPSVLEAAIAFANNNRSAAAIALERAVTQGQRFVITKQFRDAAARLLGDPTLGPKVEYLKK